MSSLSQDYGMGGTRYQVHGATTTSLHRDYVANKNRWRLCRDISDGEDTVRAAGETYLPRPSGQTDAEYQAYITRAAFVNATGRALDGLSGLIFRKDPTAFLTPKIETIKDDITMTGRSLDELSNSITVEVLTVGRVGLLVEYPTVAPKDGLTIADVESSGARPYITPYAAEDILNWREGYIKNRKVLTWVKLREWVEETDANDPGLTEYKEQLREVYLNANGVCEHLVYTTSRSEGKVKNVLINGASIDYIPFVFVGTVDSSPQIQKPPIFDIATLNVHHWQLSADRRNAIHWADSPTPIVIGNIITPDGSPVEIIKLGSSSVLNIAIGGDAKYLEFQGSGLQPTRELMLEDMSDMAVLLSRILSSETARAAAETTAIYRAGENAVLASIANSVSKSITLALSIVATWLDDATKGLSYRLNTNFYPTPMSSQMFIAMTNAIIAGTLSPEEFFDACLAGDIIRPDKTYDEHKKEIDAMPKREPTQPMGGAINPPGGNDAKGNSREPGKGDAKAQ